MCCFSRFVEDVANTRIFVRYTDGRRQAIVYQMNYKAQERLAMILPIPVADRQEDAVGFVNLEKYEKFFDDLHKGFPQPKSRGPAPPAAAAKLKVVDVGSFVASFVPKVVDLERLDEQFRLPKSTWDKLPQYRDYGFAVFQLKPDAETVHPMAFTYPTRADAPLFFPTVHIHDGQVHAKADFDHTLYLQPRDASEMLPRGWQESTQPAGMFMKIKEAQKLLDADLHVYRRTLRGSLKNEDTLV